MKLLNRFKYLSLALPLLLWGCPPPDNTSVRIVNNGAEYIVPVVKEVYSDTAKPRDPVAPGKSVEYKFYSGVNMPSDQFEYIRIDNRYAIELLYISGIDLDQLPAQTDSNGVVVYVWKLAY